MSKRDRAGIPRPMMRGGTSKRAFFLAGVGPFALERGVAAPPAAPAEGARHRVEHPTGHADVEIELAGRHVVRTSVVRTARKLSDGAVFPRPGR
ncbi:MULTISPECIES: hypothetical protein [Streptomyces]|uniref:hypothetical protein n=1 Tax=Streptomyces TaxID=1883 RepID=UPI00190766F4|nr:MULTISPECIES: hypothetical protein [unclassified Streptomyces]MCU4745885.1 hypothetical protein [Streptomyces sp. G-5]QQN76226.1 hypothetical protein IPZ77_01315 [Streptomyces sp. XC 2026]